MVRQATKDDMPYLRSQLRIFAEYPDNRDIVVFPDDVTVGRYLMDMIDGQVVLISEMGGERCGFIMGAATYCPTNPWVKVLQSHVWWINEDKRRSTHGFRLASAFLAVGECTEGVDMVTLTIEHGTKVSDNTLRRIGFRPCQHTYVAEVKSGSHNGSDSRFGRDGL